MIEISVYGLGYVGLTGAVCLASEGHDVIGIDANRDKVRGIAAGVSPIKEPGLEKMLVEGLASGRLRCATDPVEPVRTSDIAMVCVGTPSGPDGAHNMQFIAEVTRQIANAVRSLERKERLTVVYRSTIRPGTIEDMILPIFRSALGDASDKLIEVVYFPEFLQETRFVLDFFDPPRIVVGTRDGQPSARIDEMNKNLKAPTFVVPFRVSEFIKFADNNYHALKVAYANELGRICVEVGIDPKLVHKIFIADTRLNISAYYLRPGGPFGGSCLPKDVRALQHLSKELKVDAQVINALMVSNESHKEFLYKRVLKGLRPKAKVLLLGLAFKSDTDDLRESPGVELAARLTRDGFAVSIYDPLLKPEALMGQNLGFAMSHLAKLPDLLVSREAAERGDFDVAIDINGISKSLAIKCPSLMNFFEL